MEGAAGEKALVRLYPGGKHSGGKVSPEICHSLGYTPISPREVTNVVGEHVGAGVNTVVSGTAEVIDMISK
jgi:hypothetical protein